MRYAALLVMLALAAPVHVAAGPKAIRRTCGLGAAELKGPSAVPNPFPGIVPGAGLTAEDFADGGLAIEVDSSMSLVTNDPVGVVAKAAHNWEIPGTMIKFRVGGPGSGGNLVTAEPVRQAAYATVGKPGLGAARKLRLRVDVPFHDGDERLESILTHEIGHWLGFDHSFLMETVMSPILNDKINWVDPDQVAKAVLRYGTGEHALGTVHGRVSWRGAALSGARINLLGDDHRSAFGTFAASDGTYSVPVYTGSYRLFVDPNDGPAVKGNFIGTYPGGPLDFATMEAAPVTVSAGQDVTADVVVPEGDAGFRISTIEPRTAPPGAGVQAVKVYYAGAAPSEIAGLESLAPDVRITSRDDSGGIITAFFDVDVNAPAGPRTFMLRKTNGAIAIVPGAVGVVIPLRLTAPHYTLEAPADQPVRVAWEGGVAGEVVDHYAVSASADGGNGWEEVGRAPGDRTSFDWVPRGVRTSALRVRVEAWTADGRRVGSDSSLFNIGLGLPATASAPAGDDSAPPIVRVLSPNGGETIASGAGIDVSWEASDDAGLASQTVEVSADGGGHWQPVATLGSIARSYDWQPDARLRGALLIRVTARDAAGHTTSDQSDAAFTVRDRPAVTRVTAKRTASGITLKIYGTGLAADAVVTINGVATAVPAKLSAAAGRLTLKGDATALGLSATGATNRLVIAVSGLVSDEATFATP